MSYAKYWRDLMASGMTEAEAIALIQRERAGTITPPPSSIPSVPSSCVYVYTGNERCDEPVWKESTHSMCAFHDALQNELDDIRAIAGSATVAPIPDEMEEVGT